MSNLLKLYRKKRGLTQEQLAELVDTTHATIQRLESGGVTLTVKWAERLAPALRTHAANLLFDHSELVAAENLAEGAPAPAEVNYDSLPIIGYVEAGSYQPAEEMPIDDQEHILVPKDCRFPGVKRFCLEVRGTSMDREFAPGSLVICVDMYDIGGTPEDGAIYVVDRIDGGNVESTVKQLQIMDDGTAYLWPRSTDPMHQTPIKFTGTKSTEIKLKAKVIGAYALV